MNQLHTILHGTAQVVPHDELIKKLSSGKKLKVKLGMDPTAPDLHLGHAVVLRKMRQFQDLGHEAILIIGDFTAQIGDPTGRSKTRPPLTFDEIAHNQKTYLEQAGKILNTKTLTVVNNGTWLSKLTFSDIVKLCAKTTLARIIEREDFQNRLQTNHPIGFHELLYPLMQAYDSVMLEADIELGGTDQTFNLLMGRFLQEQFGQEPQVVLTMPLLEGIDGVHKMSKSYGNAIGITENPKDMFGKIMSIQDNAMSKYFTLLGYKTEAEAQELHIQVVAGTMHPMTVKKQLAHAIVTTFWSKSDADKAQEQFAQLFQHKEYQHAQGINLSSTIAKEMWIVDLLKIIGAITSSSQAKRLIEAGAVSVDDLLITDFKAIVQWHNGSIIKAGKTAIFKLVVT
jgi:tyrosyl-tRNA synthetase